MKIKTLFLRVYPFIQKIKQIKLQNLITSVPMELKLHFDHLQLENSIRRIKIICVILNISNLANLPLYISQIDRVNLVIGSNIIFLRTIFELILTLLFFGAAALFSRKNKHSMLWLICYLFVGLNFCFTLYSILLSETVLLLQTFFISTFVFTFVPDFKPRIFMSFLVVYYILVAVILDNKGLSFLYGGYQWFTFNIFMYALVLKIFFYNSMIRNFVYINKIKSINEKLEALSVTDELTKISNRRAFMNYIDIIWKQGRRLQLPVNVLIIDIDNYKKYNDSLGHLEGDKALIAVAQHMNGQIKRETDLVARFGGEEFICLLPYIKKDDAAQFALELVQSVENMHIPHPMSEISKYITVSAGMASVIPDDNNTLAQLLEEADKALYKAKNTGKNKVIVN